MDTETIRPTRRQSNSNVTADWQAKIDAAQEALHRRELRQFHAREVGELDAKLRRFWGAFPDGIALVIRAADAARRVWIYREGSPFLLTMPDLEDLMVRCEGRCELSGVPFSGETVAGTVKRPFIPSIDRIKPKEAYTPENVRLVCWAVNLALGEWGDEVFWRIVRTAAARG